MKQYSFTKNNRLRSNEQFKSVLEKRFRAGDDLLIIYLAANDLGYKRLGVSVGKSCGSAVIRNRLKRLIRESFRLSKDQITEGFDFIVMMNPQWCRKYPDKAELKRAAGNLKMQQVQRSLVKLASKAMKKAQNREDSGNGNQKENQV